MCHRVITFSCYQCFALLVVPGLPMSVKGPQEDICNQRGTGNDHHNNNFDYVCLLARANFVFPAAIATPATTLLSEGPRILHEAWSPLVFEAMSFLTCRSLVPVTSSILRISDMQSLEL